MFAYFVGRIRRRKSKKKAMKSQRCRGRPRDYQGNHLGGRATTDVAAEAPVLARPGGARDSERYIALVSGLRVGHATQDMLPLQLLAEGREHAFPRLDALVQAREREDGGDVPDLGRRREVEEA